ncbi:MAG: hypothetical protein KGZ75_10970 [Syntrophomonadaceae bacterium]|nr:hypothetical protein [Syntrophomonadaceae bacterium]
MSNTLYTATGCTRCKIVKDFMHRHGVDYVEKDIRADGKEDFQDFYKKNRVAIIRGADGIEFPIFADGKAIRQGIAAAIAYLHSGEKLEGFFGVGTLHKEWVDGIHISAGNPKYAEDFVSVLRYLKSNNMKLQIETNGKNSGILQLVFNEDLADAVIMNILGPLNLYGQILGEEVEMEDLIKSIALVAQFPNYKYQVTVAPLMRKDGNPPEISYLTPEEMAEIARLIEEVTRTRQNPFFIRLFKPEETIDEGLKAIAPMSSSALLTYRTAARAYQVLAEIAKQQ